MKKRIQAIFNQSIDIKKQFVESNLERIENGARLMSRTIASGHKILVFGNGGSAADAQHIAAEFVNRFRLERRPLPAIALTTDTSIITSIGNDYHFDQIFEKQVQALGKKDDMAIGISTSGNSKNVIMAMEAAREAGMLTMGFSGKGGKLAKVCDLVFPVDSDNTARVQEVHITLAHALCELVEKTLFE